MVIWLFLSSAAGVQRGEPFGGGAGGEAVAAANTAARAAAEEAATGAWVRELDSGAEPRIAAPGLSHGVFGAWSRMEVASRSHGLLQQTPESLIHMANGEVIEVKSLH